MATLPTRLTKTRSMRRASTLTSGSSAGTSSVSGCLARSAPSEPTADSTTSRSGFLWNWSFKSPPWIRAMSIASRATSMYCTRSSAVATSAAKISN